MMPAIGPLLFLRRGLFMLLRGLRPGCRIPRQPPDTALSHLVDDDPRQDGGYDCENGWEHPFLSDARIGDLPLLSPWFGSSADYAVGHPQRTFKVRHRRAVPG